MEGDTVSGFHFSLRRDLEEDLSDLLQNLGRAALVATLLHSVCVSDWREKRRDIWQNCSPLI